MKFLPKILRNRGLFFWILVVQLVGFGFLTIALDFKAASVSSWFETFSNSPFAIPATVVIYLLGAFVNAPQWMMHGGAILVFGPVWGSLIAWNATLVSASFNFWLGRRLGARRVNRMSGGFFGKFLYLIKSHGFWASLAVRIVPTGPFLIVNLVAGVTRMKFLAFLSGTALGIIPKIALVVSISEGVRGAAVGKGPIYIAIVSGVALIWLVVIYGAGSYITKKRALRKLTEEQNTLKDAKKRLHKKTP